MMFEEMALVERKWQLDDLKEGDQRDRHHDHGDRFFGPPGHPLRERGGEFAQAVCTAEQQQAQQQNAGDRRP